MSKSRKTSNIANVIQADAQGNITIPGAVTLSYSPASNDNSSYAASTAWVSAYVAANAGSISGSGSSNYIVKWTGGTSLGTSSIYDDGTNIGIGTTNTLTNLTIGDRSTQQQPYISLARTATGGYWAGIRWYDGVIINSYIQEDSNFNLRFGTLNTEHFRITSTGYLSLNGTNVPSGIVQEVSGATPLLGLDVNFRGDWNSAYPGAQIRVDMRTGQPAFSFLYRGAGSTTDNVFMAIKDSGYIGINTSSPNALLEINGGAYGTSLRINTSHVNGAGVTLISTDTGGKRWDIVSGGTNNAVGAGGIQLYNTTDSIMRMGIKTGGQVGFNTTAINRHYVFSNPSNPGAEGFEINATSGIITFLSYNRATNTYLPISLAEGPSNVLIGTLTDNGYKLEVNGTAKFSGQAFSQVENLGTVTGSVTFNWNTSNIKRLVLANTGIPISFSNPAPGATYTIILVQDGNGSRTVTWPTIKWAGGSTPTLSTAANKTDIVTLVYDGSSYYGVFVGNM